MKKRAFLCLALFAWTALFVAASEYFYETVPLPEQRQKHGVVCLGDFIYVIGGYQNPPGAFTANVKAARILSDGSLSSWSNVEPLPEIRSYVANSVLTVGERIYVVAGMDHRRRNRNTVCWTTQNEDGSLERWRITKPLPADGLCSAAAVATPGFIHVIGGQRNDGKPCPMVYSGRLGIDGDVLKWESAPSLPLPLWFHHSGVCGDRLFVWGGLTTTSKRSASPVTYSAPILESGRIGDWRRENSMLPAGLYRGASVVAGRLLMTFSPSYSSGRGEGEIVYAELTADGLSLWRKMEIDLPVKYYLAAAVDPKRGKIFIPGGRADFSRRILDQRVFVFDVNPRAVTQMSQNQMNPSAYYSHQTPASGEESAAGEVQGRFYSLVDGRRAAALNNRPIVYYFYSPRSTLCRDQSACLKPESRFDELAREAVFIKLDTQKYRQLAKSLNVFRAPTWVFFHTDGSEYYRHNGVLTLDQIRTAALSLR